MYEDDAPLDLRSIGFHRLIRAIQDDAGVGGVPEEVTGQGVVRNVVECVIEGIKFKLFLVEGV